jgi:tetratricopeptide (TPR) repeat protein
MPDPVRDDDHDARIAALSAFEASITSNVDTGLKELGTLNDPLRMHAAIQLLIQNDRFQDAIDLVSGRSLQGKWIELIVYAHVALKDLASAKLLVDNARDYCKTAWSADRCRIAVADSAFSEVLQNTLGGEVIATGGLADDERRILEFVVDVLNPLVAPVRLSGRVDSEIQRAAVEYAVNAHGLLGQFSQIAGLIEPMLQCIPVPLLIAQLALRRVCEPPKGLSGRIRAEHPGNFTALFLAALLDREVYDRSPQSLNALIGLQQLACDLGPDTIEQLCQGLFETASAMNPAALTRSRGVIDSLLGASNRFQLYFNAVGQLMQSDPGNAIRELDSDKREEDAVWWQIAAKAHEMIGDMPKATHCWDQACRLMPHPDMLTRFAGMSIQQHRFEDAVRALTTAAVQTPDDPRILEQLAFAHTRLRQFSQAKEVFQRLVRVCPGVPRLLVNVAICDVHSGDPLSALNSLDTAIEHSGSDLQLLSMRAQILTSLDRAKDAFTDLHRQRSEYWNNASFLVLYMDTAYRAGKEKESHAAFQVLMSMQQNGQLPQPLFRSVTLDELKEIGTERLRQRDWLFSEIVIGKVPWLVAESALGSVPDEAWHCRTQSLRWLPEDFRSRGEWTIYATNGFSVFKTSERQTVLSRIKVPRANEPVVADLSAIMTLHRLGHLTLAADYFGKLILPASFGSIPVHDAQRLTQHQPSREQELRCIQDLVQRRLITFVDDGELVEGMPSVDEYCIDENSQTFNLADVAYFLQQTQRLTSSELAELRPICHRERKPEREIARDTRVRFVVSSLRSLAKYEWLERVLPNVKWCVTRADFDDEMRELHKFELQRSILHAHQAMWDEINQLRRSGKLEYRDSESRRRFRDEEADNNGDIDDDREPPPYLDAVLLANDLHCRLLADDRVCQTAVLSGRPDIEDLAFGTDLLLIGLQEQGMLSVDEVSSDLISMMRWRYRFLLPEPLHLKAAAMRSRESLPGPELRQMAAYVQESMRDPGLFCGMEKSEPPTPIAFKYFMGWKELCVQFLASIWEDASIENEQLKLLTTWCLDSLLPAVPRGLRHMPLGRRLGALTPKAIMLSAMIRFATVQPVERANEALRLMSKCLGMTEDEFYDAAAEAADDRYF